jgi:hypothetical protein
MKKLIGFMFLLIISVCFVSSFEFDNVISSNQITKDQSITLGDNEVAYNPIWEKYQPIEIKNSFGLGQTLFKGAITKHTDTCLSNCESIINVNHAGGVLVKDIRFIGGKPKNYNIQIGNVVNEYSVDDYKEECLYEDVVGQNGTIYKEEISCNNVNIGKHTEEVIDWKDYQINSEVQEGNYRIKISGSLDMYETTDWQINVQGQWIEDWAVWDSGLVAYYKMDDNAATTNVIDSSVKYNGTASANTNVLYNSSGKIGSTLKFNSSLSRYINIGSTTNLLNTTTGSWSVWINVPDSTPAADQDIIMFGSSTLNIQLYLAIETTGKIVLYMGNGGGHNSGLRTNSKVINDNTWHHIVVDQNATDKNIYIDGSKVPSTYYDNWNSKQWFPNATTRYNVGSIGRFYNWAAAGSYFDGLIDEVGLWNRSLSPSEVSELYNSGSGMTYTPGIVVTLNSPANLQMSNNNTIITNSSAIVSGTTLKNVTLFDNRTGSWAVRNSTTKNGTSNSTTFINTYSNGRYAWNMQWCAFDNTCKNATGDYIFIVDSSKPNVTINSGSGLQNYGSLAQNHTINFTVTDANLDKVIVRYNGTNRTITGAVSGVSNITSFQLVENLYNATIYANNTAGGLNTTNISWSYKIFNYNNTYQSSVDAGQVSELSTNVTYYNLYNSITAILNYNNSNYTMSSSDVGNNKKYIYLLTSPSVNSVQNISFYFIYILTNSTTTDYIYSSTYNQTVRPFIIDDCLLYNRTLIKIDMIDEESMQSINGTILASIKIYTQDHNTLVTSYNKSLTYNGTQLRLCTIDSISNIYSLDYIIQHYGSQNITYPTQASTTYFNTPTGTTTVTSYTYCPSTNSTTISASSYNNTNVNLTYSNTSTTSINPISNCTTTQVTTTQPITSNQTTTTTTTEGVSPYFKKFRMVQNITLTNDTLQQNITLYNLLQGTGKNSFTIRVTGNYLSSTGNSDLLVEAQKRYISFNAFYLVESTVTSQDGQTILHLEPNDEVYNFIVSYMGQTLGTFNNYQVQCSNPSAQQCEVVLSLSQSTASLPDFTNTGKIRSTYLYDNTTRNLYMTFTSTDGSAHTVKQIVLKNDGFLNTTVCNNTAYGTSGTLICTIPSIYTNSSVISNLVSDSTYISTKTFWFGENPDFAGVDIIIELLMFSTLVLLFIGHPIFIVIGGMFGLICSFLLLFIGTASFGDVFFSIIYYLVAGGIIIWQISKRM